MNDFLKYLSTAPVFFTFLLSFTAVLIIFINFIYPNALTFPIL